MELNIKRTAKVIGEISLKDLGSYGSFIFYIVIAALFLLIGDYTIFYSLIVSLAAVTAVVMFFRLSYNKPRPGMKKRRYNLIYEAVDNSSFPSIHAARSVMISIAIYAKAPATFPLLALMVLAVCASRIYFRRHDIIDIFAGLILGFILGFLFFL